jgi:hypothetical protein
VAESSTVAQDDGRAAMGGSVALLAAKRMPGTVVAVVGVDTLQNAEFKLPEEVRKQILYGVEKDFNLKAFRKGAVGRLGERLADSRQCC